MSGAMGELKLIRSKSNCRSGSGNYETALGSHDDPPEEFSSCKATCKQQIFGDAPLATLMTSLKSVSISAWLTYAGPLDSTSSQSSENAAADVTVFLIVVVCLHTISTLLSTLEKITNKHIFKEMREVGNRPASELCCLPQDASQVQVKHHLRDSVGASWIKKTCLWQMLKLCMHATAHWACSAESPCQHAKPGMHAILTCGAHVFCRTAQPGHGWEAELHVLPRTQPSSLPPQWRVQHLDMQKKWCTRIHSNQLSLFKITSH